LAEQAVLASLHTLQVRLLILAAAAAVLFTAQAVSTRVPWVAPVVWVVVVKVRPQVQRPPVHHWSPRRVPRTLVVVAAVRVAVQAS
jgi:hypothetical protein